MNPTVLRLCRALGPLLMAACGDQTASVPPGSLQAAVGLTSDSVFRRVVREATLVFVGSVVQRGATTEEGLTATRLMTVLQVDSVLRGPRGAGNFAGERVTLVSAPADTIGLAPGKRATFFAHGLAAGESLIIRGMLSYDASAPDSVSRVSAAFREALQLDADSALARLGRASHLVVRGVVGQQIRIVVPDSIVRRYSNERSPQWWHVVVTNLLYLGGDSTLMRPSLDVYYPVREEEDARWPRLFTSGDTLILLLRRASEMPSAIRRVVAIPERFFLMDSAAVLPRSDSARVRNVLR